MPSTESGTRYWASLVLIGAVGGLLSGLFGVGGGILMVPLLIAVAGMDQRRAAATSLVAILPTAVAGAIGYLARGEVDLVVALLVSVGGVAGSWVGSRLLRRIPLPALRWMFIALVGLVAVRMVMVDPVRGSEVHLNGVVAVELIAIGLVTGTAAGLFGIGGGVIVVPALMLLVGASDLLAKGTSLTMMIPTSAAGSWSNANAGLVNLKAGFAVGVAAVATSFIGVALAFRLPGQLSSALFAALLVVTAIQLTVRAVRAARSDQD